MAHIDARPNQPADESDPALMSTAESGVRWGGALMAAGLLVSLIGFIVWNLGVDNRAIAEAQDAATRATLFVKGRGAFEFTGWISVPADIALVVGGLLLGARPVHVRSRFPASAFWLLVTVAGIQFLALDVLYATAFTGIAEAQGREPGLFGATEAVANALFTVSIATISIGLAGVFWVEARSTTAAMPQWLAYAGIAGCVSSFIGALGPTLHLGALTAFLVLSILVFAAAIFLGFRIAHAGARSQASPTSR